MAKETRGELRPLLGFRFLATALIGTLTMALVCALATPAVQIAVLGTALSILTGLFVSRADREEARGEELRETLNALRVPVGLAPEPGFFEQYRAFTLALPRLAEQSDPVLREFALMKLASLSAEVRSLAEGRVVFTSTEAWRAMYEKLLLDPGIRRYDSVAWVKTKDYWQDAPGRQSMRLNFDLVERGVWIERVIILRGDLWPPAEPLPAPDIRPWIREQHDRGIHVSLVREADLHGEPGLLSDFGIYGDRATGIEELDERARTTRFVLLFDRASIQFARDRLERISLYAKRYTDVLEGGRA